MNTFKCFNCPLRSRYLRRVEVVRLEMARDMIGAFDGTDETRTYECEHCCAENRITNSKQAWMVIDLEARST